MGFLRLWVLQRMKLHQKDMKILRELDFGARQPVSVIARKVGLSPEVTAYRIKQLEQKGIITGYYPVIDLSKLGYLFCRYVLYLEKLTPEIEESLFSYMEENTAVGWVLISDNFRVTLVGYARTIQEAKELGDKISFRFNPLIKKKYFSIATRIYHLRRKYLWGDLDDEVLLWGDEGEVSIDSTDRALLQLLVKDTKMPATEMAKIVGLTSMAVLTRLKKMQQQKLIQGYRCALDLKKLGVTHVKVFLYLEGLTKERSVSLRQFIGNWLYSVYITEAFGKADLEFECHIPQLYLLDEFLRKMRSQFPEIRNYENFIHYRECIRRYLLE